MAFGTFCRMFGTLASLLGETQRLGKYKYLNCSIHEEDACSIACLKRNLSCALQNRSHSCHWLFGE